jgi:hypothetical protein
MVTSRPGTTGIVRPRQAGSTPNDAFTWGTSRGHDVVKYQPASRYWHFQLAESALFLALAAVLVGVAIVYTLRRDA